MSLLLLLLYITAALLLYVDDAVVNFPVFSVLLMFSVCSPAFLLPAWLLM